ncbi:MAG: hypothetical protein J6Y90_04040, partial [Lachnospiraceae bacterium]|nr:hypothetical protein [Lachnospiraceae bacterium]
TSVLDSDNVRINGVNILMKKVPSGIWYMKERTLEKDGDGNYVIDGAGYYNSLSGMPSGYELNLKTYILLVGQTALDGYKATDRDTRTDEWRTGGVLAYIGEAQIKSQIGTTNPKMFAIFEIDSDPNSSTYGKAMPASDIARFGIVNESVNKPRIILRKLSPIYSVLSGAHFRIFKLNLEEVTYAWPVGKSHYESTLHSGVFFAGRLPMGKYYIVETRKPDEAKDENTGKVFEMTIDANGVTKKRIGEDLLTGSDVLVTIAGGYEAEIIEKFKAWVRNR